ncbi:MAG TPA: type II secretion system protein [Candidatus Saccharibacteria bacterium]|nr:type II secretion system protein [Candidatus Saccharibacteria bacterium]
MKPSRQSGFTTVELIVVILVTASFIASISQMISFVSRTATEAHHQNVAGNLAYDNLGKYANGQRATWFICNSTSDGKLTSNNGIGQILLSGQPQNTAGLPGPVEQRVTAFAPYGCSSAGDSDMPVRVISEIKYGNPAKEVIHATYVNR